MSDDYYDDMIRQRGGDEAAKIFADDCRKVTAERDRLRALNAETKGENDRLRAEIARMQIAFDQELSRREDRRASRD